jgi:DNA-binding GntR family transcriptional regulator
MDAQPILAGSVVEVAYERIRAMIVEGAIPPDGRLNQGELADAFGISRTSVREALHRLVGDTLVEFRRNRGFFVAAPLQLHAVISRLEMRLLLEPGMARLASERRNDKEIRALRRVISGQQRARSPRAAHDLSREFHSTLAQATRNSELIRAFEALWTPDIGRQLLARRLQSPTWQAEDVSEHEQIADAVERGDGERAAHLMYEHLHAAHAHWLAELAETEPTPIQ